MSVNYLHTILYVRGHNRLLENLFADKTENVDMVFITSRLSNEVCESISNQIYGILYANWY